LATHEVTVLEARERVGGRVVSLEHEGWHVEQGAGWLHGIGNNDLAPLAKKLGLEVRSARGRGRGRAGSQGDVMLR
jgi:polyamine oxidase